MSPRTVTDGALLPVGTATFLFTDIEGSTRLVQETGALWSELLDVHRTVLRRVWTAHHGVEVATEGDAFFVAFGSARDAVAAAADGQRALAAQAWPGDHAIRVRMGLHTGEARVVADDYEGLDVHRAARVQSAAHGGQVLVSEATSVLARDGLPKGVSLRDMGEQRLKDLLQPLRLFQLVVEGLPSDFPPIKTLSNTPNNLPVQLTSFVGRESELAAARGLLAGTRLLTLTGPGGTGKTRLSLQLAAEAADDFADGVYFAGLATTADPALVPASIALALDVKASGSRPVLEEVIEHLRRLRVLLVLDNFEQVLPAAPMVADILAGAPGVTVVVSSRAPLRLRGEQEYPVPALGLPDPDRLPPADELGQYEAIRLFVQRAIAVKPDFALTDENAAAVAGICARLDGLPLAIELAAARVRLLPPQALLSRLEVSLERTLGAGGPDLPARQKTLSGAIAWSYDLLDPAVRKLFSRFGVFMGGASLEMIQAVCDTDLEVDVLDGLETLVQQSLVRQREVGGEPRFSMLSTICEYALERLDESGEAAGVRDRHARVCLELAEQAAPHLTSGDRKTWLDRLQVEHDNIRAALGRLVERGATAEALRLATALARFWQARGHLIEGADRLRQVLGMPDGEADPRLRALALGAAGNMIYWQGDMPGARELYLQGLSLAREAADRALTAEALYNAGFTHVPEGGDFRTARTQIEEALGIFRELGDRPGEAKTLWALSTLEAREGDLVAASEHVEASLEILRDLDERYGMGWTLRQAGMVAMRLGDLDRARSRLQEALSMVDEAGDASSAAIILGDTAQLLRARGEVYRSAVLRAAVGRINRNIGTRMGDVADAAQDRGAAGEGLSDQESQAAAAEGEAMDLATAVAYALK